MLALLSVSDKTGLTEFAQGLHALGCHLLSTGGTLAALTQAGIPATKVSAHTGSPEILDGRVKTLHPKIHGGLLGRPTRDADELQANGIAPIALLAVNLYPFRQTIARAAPREEAIENIDIGGPAMIRAAAKNAEHVAVVVDPRDYPAILEELRAHGTVTATTRSRLQAKAFRHTASYDAAIAAYLSDDSFPDALTLDATQRSLLRYGENPHQRAALYQVGSTPGIASATVLQGKELSYNNILDLDAALGVLLELSATPAAVVIKHHTPCGVARGEELEETYRRARAVDETSAFGGIVALNRDVDAATASALAETFLEAVLAPSWTKEALAILAAKKNLRLLSMGSWLASPAAKATAQLDLRSIAGGLLLMDRDSLAPATEWRLVTRRPASADERAAAELAWKIVKHVSSNAITFANARELISQAGGQTSRVDSVRIAAQRGGAKLVGSAAASDAFFPFRDGLDAIVASGATCVVQPGGSVRDEEVIAAADEANIAMYFTGTRHFRH